MAQTMISFILFLLASQGAQAATFQVASERSEVGFLAVGRPSMLKVKGEGGKPSGTFTTGEKAGGEIQVDLREFSTGITLRDKHMKEKYLELDKPENQFAKLKITSIELPGKDIPASGEVDAKITGTLALHGKSQPVRTDSKLKIEGKNLSTEMKIKLKLSDFGIAIPSYAGITVAEDVDVDVKIQAEQK